MIIRMIPQDVGIPAITLAMMSSEYEVYCAILYIYIYMC